MVIEGNASSITAICNKPASIKKMIGNEEITMVKAQQSSCLLYRKMSNGHKNILQNRPINLTARPASVTNHQFQEFFLELHFPSDR